MPSLFLGIFFGTFLLEDGALAAALILIARHQITWTAGFVACFAGIAIGDLGLYILGAALARIGEKSEIRLIANLRSRLQNNISPEHMGRAVVVSRFLPGTRLPTYLGAGFVAYPLGRFLAITVVTVFAWVMLAFLGGRSIQMFLSQHWLLSIGVILGVMHIGRKLIPRLLDPWDRKVLRHTWRKWLHFEFWPAWLFYLPVAIRYIALSLKNRSVLTPFYAHPYLPNGGFVGESKWDFLKNLSAADPATLKTVLVGKGTPLEVFDGILREQKLDFPLILKPDVGQRGFGVRIVRNRKEFSEYLTNCDFDVLLQELATGDFEAGVFYIRMPADEHGQIFSITDKKFPFIEGDGKTCLGDLILADARARIIADVYFSRMRDRLSEIPAMGEKVLISECGNHCQGAIFENGRDLNSAELLAAIEKISAALPGFFFGRFDIKYTSPQELKLGRGFKIVEINGIGSEATHIWDPRTTLREAYRVLFEQWGILFAIGRAAKDIPLGKRPPKFFEILGEVMRLRSRKSKLSISS